MIASNMSVLVVRRVEKRRNQDIPRELGVNSMKEFLEHKKLIWCRHCIKMEEERQVKKIWGARSW